MENAQNIMKEIIWQNTKKYQQQQDFAQECMHIYQKVMMSFGSFRIIIIRSGES